MPGKKRIPERLLVRSGKKKKFGLRQGSGACRVPGLNNRKKKGKKRGTQRTSKKEKMFISLRKWNVEGGGDEPANRAIQL